jgi:hypothetical protein
LPFSNTTSTTTLGYDFSPAGNNWTTNNISLTAGSTYDSMTDVPTLTSATAANYCVWNSLPPPNANFTNAFANGSLNATITSSAAGGSAVLGTLGMSSGKWYWETTVLNAGGGPNIDVGIMNLIYGVAGTGNGNGAIGYSPYGYAIFTTGGVNYKVNNNVATAYGTSYTTNDVIMCAFDATNGNLWFGKNGTWMASGDPAAGTSPTFSSIPSASYAAGFGNGAGLSGRVTQTSVNFGQQPWTYTPPTGYVGLNTYNI